MSDDTGYFEYAVNISQKIAADSRQSRESPEAYRERLSYVIDALKEDIDASKETDEPSPLVFPEGEDG